MERLNSRVLALLLFLTLWFACGSILAVQAQEPDADVDVPILMYHDVWDTATPCNYWSITKDLFEKQMQALSAYGYDTVSLQDFLDYRNGSATPPDHPIILTFDDGHYGLYTAARPVLNSYGFVGTGFLTTDWVATSWGHRGGCRWDTMFWSEAATMLAEGHTFESHTKSHPLLTSIPITQAQEEIEGSKTEIENQLGNEVQFFAYPSGDGLDNPTIRSYVQQAGYQAAVAAYPDGIANTATSDIWALPRIMIVEKNTVDLDPAHPEDFFMRKVDPDFPLPMLQVTSVRAFDTVGCDRDTFYPGESVKVTVHVINNGDNADLVATLNLDIDANDATPPVYDSSTTDPSEDVAFSLAHGQGADLNFYYQLPPDATTGPYYYALGVRDTSKTLGFLFDGWTELFTFYVGVDTTTIGPDEGGALLARPEASTITLSFPPGAVSEPVSVSLGPALGPAINPSVPGGLAPLSRPYALQDWTMACQPVTSFQRPFTVTVEYEDAALPPGMDDGSLMLYVWDEGAGEWGGIPSQVDVEAHRLVAHQDRAVTFAVLGRIKTDIKTYLPIIVNGK